MFPICILAIVFLGLGLAIGLAGLMAIPVGLSLVPLGESANRYANPIRRARSVRLVHQYGLLIRVLGAHRSGSVSIAGFHVRYGNPHAGPLQ